MTIIEEPLEISAPLAWQRAPELCHQDPDTQENCAWNHGLWQYLRLLDLITTPQHHAEFFKEAFARIPANAGSPRVLISGTADYSMLAHVLAIIKDRNAPPAVTVVDRCETPLFLNRWYAQQQSCSIETCRSDILEYQPASAFDVICSHSFLGQFTTSQRLQLMTKWRDILVPGGLVATVNRVRPNSAMSTVGFSEEQGRTFSATVLRKADAMRGIITVDPRQLAEQALIYASKQSAYPVKSREEIRNLFEQGGFDIEQLTCAPVKAGLDRSISGPTTPGSAEYACIVARRR